MISTSRSTTSRVVALALVLMSSVAACDDSKSSTDSTDVVPTSDTLVLDTSVPDSTTPSSTAPESTVPDTVAPDVVTVDPDGLGEAKLGDEPESVITYFSTLFGAPASDSGWFDDGSCIAETMRVVQWPNLYTVFADTDAYDASITADQQFVFFSYALSFGEYPSEPLATDRGLVLGDTTDRLLELYPEVIAYDGSLGGRFYKFSDDNVIGPNGILQDTPEIVGSIEAGDWPCADVR